MFGGAVDGAGTDAAACPPTGQSVSAAQLQRSRTASRTAGQVTIPPLNAASRLICINLHFFFFVAHSFILLFFYFFILLAPYFILFCSILLSVLFIFIFITLFFSFSVIFPFLPSFFSP